MDAHLITALGDELFNALRNRQTLAPLTRRYPEITLEQAYGISCSSSNAAKPSANG